jgi:hypothetical protein
MGLGGKEKEGLVGRNGDKGEEEGIMEERERE